MRHKATLAAGLLLLAGTIGTLAHRLAGGGQVARLVRSADPQERLTAVRKLAEDTSRAARNSLAGLCRDSDVQVASEAVRALDSQPQSARREVFEQLAGQSVHGQVRGEAAAALGRCPQADLSILLTMLRSDAEPAARAGAARGLARRRDPAAAAALLEALDDPSQEVRLWAVTALGNIAGVRYSFQAEAPDDLRRQQLVAIREHLRAIGLL